MGTFIMHDEDFKNLLHQMGQYCEDEECMKCCPHEEYEHDLCLDCGYERDPGEEIDAAMAVNEDIDE